MPHWRITRSLTCEEETVMPVITQDRFTFTYTLRTRHDPQSHDIQFGMDFVLSNNLALPMCQLIFPATQVGSNLPGRWNIDNHAAPGEISSLYYRGSEQGTITDIPTELSHADRGFKRTWFCVYIINPDKAELYKQGVKFGYEIDTANPAASTALSGFQRFEISNEQIQLVRSACSFIRIV